jgi:hypothetical protein
MFKFHFKPKRVRARQHPDTREKQDKKNGTGKKEEERISKNSLLKFSPFYTIIIS